MNKLAASLFYSVEKYSIFIVKNRTMFEYREESLLYTLCKINTINSLKIIFVASIFPRLSFALFIFLLIGILYFL
jgi:hypothetical protein